MSQKKLIHLADLHLGAKLHNYDRLEEQILFLDWLCALLAREKPDVLVLAGDLFDVYYPAPSVQRVWFDFLARLRRENLVDHVVAIAGNHDSPSALGASGRVLDLVGVSLLAGDLTPEEEAIRIPCADGGCLAIAALPFLREGALRNQGHGDAAAGFAAHAAAALAAAREKAPGAPLVAVAHCTLASATLSDNTSEHGRRTIGGVDAVSPDVFKGADYVALGHLHIPQAVGGAETIRYAGTPLPMSFDEAAGRSKTVTVATFTDGAGSPVDVREIEVPPFRPLRLFRGSPEAILADAAAWKPAAGPVGAAWAALSATEGEGSFADLCQNARDLFAANGVELISNADDRRRAHPRAADAPLPVAAVRALDPVKLAEERLAESDLHLTDAQQAEYLALLKDLLA